MNFAPAPANGIHRRRLWRRRSSFRSGLVGRISMPAVHCACALAASAVCRCRLCETGTAVRGGNDAPHDYRSSVDSSKTTSAFYEFSSRQLFGSAITSLINAVWLHQHSRPDMRMRFVGQPVIWPMFDAFRWAIIAMAVCRGFGLR